MCQAESGRHTTKSFDVEFDLGSAEGKQKTLRPKSARRVSEKLSGKLNSSLAVFYVEQVALNRHVSPQPQQFFYA